MYNYTIKYRKSLIANVYADLNNIKANSKGYYKPILVPLELNADTSNPATIFLSKGKLSLKLDTSAYKILNKGAITAKNEYKYWFKHLIESEKLSNFFNFFKATPSSKRATLTMWNDEYRDKDYGPSTVYLIAYYTPGDKYLYFNAHLRSNNLSTMVKIDMDVFIAIAQYLAKETGVSKIRYTHLIDIPIKK